MRSPHVWTRAPLCLGGRYGPNIHVTSPQSQAPSPTRPTICLVTTTLTCVVRRCRSGRGTSYHGPHTTGTRLRLWTQQGWTTRHRTRTRSFALAHADCPHAPRRGHCCGRKSFLGRHATRACLCVGIQSLWTVGYGTIVVVVVVVVLQ